MIMLDSNTCSYRSGDVPCPNKCDYPTLGMCITHYKRYKRGADMNAPIRLKRVRPSNVSVAEWRNAYLREYRKQEHVKQYLYEYVRRPETKAKTRERLRRLRKNPEWVREQRRRDRERRANKKQEVAEQFYGQTFKPIPIKRRQSIFRDSQLYEEPSPVVVIYRQQKC